MPPLIVSIAYGDEHEVYLRAKNLWRAYKNFFDGVKVTFLRSSDKLMEDEYIFKDDEYVFGISCHHDINGLKGMSPFDSRGFTVDRSIKFYKKIMSDNKKPFWLYHSTVTSAVDFRVLKHMIDGLECNGVYAGPILHAQLPHSLSDDLPGGGIFRMISGSGVLLSSDMIDLVLSREDMVPHNQLADVWLALTLRDIPRVPLPRCDILDIKNYGLTERFDLEKRLEKEISLGHYAFRVKSGRWELNDSNRKRVEEVDLMVINEILLFLLCQEPKIEEAVNGWKKLRGDVCDIGEYAMAPIAQ